MSEQAYFARALLNAQLPVPTELRAWNNSDLSTRFGVYRNNVVVGLIDALADTFPVTQALVGEEFFRAMARVYLQTQTARPKVLVWLGADFADFVAGFAPAAALAYLADVARLEMLRVRAYHAADAQALNLSALGALLNQPAALVDLKLELHPSVHLLQSQHAVWSLWAAHHGIGALETVQTELAQSVLVFRLGLNVEMLNVSLAQGRWLASVLAGAGLAQAANSAASLDPEFDLSLSLATLIQQQLITGPDLSL